MKLVQVQELELLDLFGPKLLKNGIQLFQEIVKY